MKKKWLLLITLGLAFILAMPALTGCGSTSPTASPTAPTPTTPVDEYALTVAKVQDSTTSFEITEYTTGKKSGGTTSFPEFTKILQLLDASTVKQTTTKTATTIENGKTVTVPRTIPYPIGFIITFYLKDGSVFCK